MNQCKSIADIKAIPFWSQFSEEQIKASVKRSAEGIRTMQAKALSTGKKVGGFTSDQLEEIAFNYENMLK
jgi:hypothetical protein